MIGLSLNSQNQSEASLGSKLAEAELLKRVETLETELAAARDALERLQARSDDDASNPTSRLGSSAASPLRHKRAIAPPSKKGYLFKWMDRTIGFGGTKWALRFVTLEGGRLSYFGSHSDVSPRYVLNLKGCAVREDGWKRNRRHASFKLGYEPAFDEPGAYFFIFSVYQRDDTPFTTSPDAEDAEIIPLLRLSSPSLAEKSRWVQVIAEACEYCETEDYQDEEARRASELMLQQQQQMNMALTMPEAHEGTLPALYFAPAFQAPKKRPSMNKKSPSKLFRSTSRTFNKQEVDERATKGYPPSKPMHRAAVPSYLSMEGRPQNYRGFFNLGMIILVVSNFRLILSNVRQEGFVLAHLLRQINEFPHIQSDPWEEAPFISGFLLQFAFITIAFAVEWLLSRKKIDRSMGMILHYMNAHSTLLIPLAIVWRFIDSPPIGAILLLQASVTWMKLISYIQANEDYRISGPEIYHAALALVENLDPEDVNIVYPRNVTLGNILYFWLAPTLTYQIAFPRYPTVRYLNVLGILFRMILGVAIFMFLVAQIVTPALHDLIEDLKETRGTITPAIMAEYWLRLSITNTYLWLLMFYIYFHLYMNLFAELLRFGDRVFYKDWWNSSEVSAYWRLWNTPVHYWLIRHVYFPCLRLHMSRVMATFVVFFLSAVMHEVLVSVPFHMIRPWSFIGMMMQMPLVAFTKYLERQFPGSSIGNIIFWISFCVVGQPMAILLYTVDYQYGKQQASMSMLDDQQQHECRVMLYGRCLIQG